LKVAIIGLGYVGQAIEKSHQNDTVVICDPKREDSVAVETIGNCDAIYVSVPSPQREDGSCDTRILQSVLSKLNVPRNKSTPIIAKTTAPPSVYQKLNQQYQNLVHCPEFLTAANNCDDYLRSEFFILGGRDDFRSRAQRIISTVLPNSVGVLTDIKTAALYKYMVNCYLATKVTFMNEFAQLADSVGVDWEDLVNITAFEKRIGKSHMQVPGADGVPGWGGMCFPKDTSALVHEAQQIGIDMLLLNSTIATNQKHREI